MAAYATLIPLFPLLAALLIGGLHFCRIIDGEAGEKTTARLALTAISLSVLTALSLLIADLSGQLPDSVSYGTWLRSGSLIIDYKLTTGGFSLALASLFSLLLLVAIRFSVNYMHRETGFHRFFFVLNLFAAAMLLLVLSGNAVFTFIAWEIAGVCSYWLIAYAYYRPIAAHNATRVFVTNRIGDGGFILAIGLALAWLENADWQTINLSAADLEPGDATLLALSFAVAAFAKSAQIPFTPWLARAMEGPTPSSAIFYGGAMIHAGVFLIIQLEPLFMQAPLAMSLLTVIGALTAIYSYWVGLSQTDIKSSQIFATSAQLGLMFVECGLGFWTLAAWHLCAHAVVRCYLLLTAPSILHNTHGQAIRPVAPALANCRWAFIASLQRGWLEPAMDWLLVKPVLRLAKDVRYIDEHIVDPALGAPAPAIKAVSSLAQWEEQKMGANLNSQEDSFAQGSGLAGKLAQWTAALLNWFEYHFILRGIGRDSIRLGRRLGQAANRFEQLLLQPRYLALFVLITLMVALGYR
ncbi:proton-conducting transporter transmembrane domain-containing protein [Methylomonas sp. MK1]|uniref:proton-conducting transporter transmembrane domain-containing protein n=1 Tax=Methylomonas sp. MK1 TaxID=1131552 RepID=UPI000367A561|nr:proton-conducting transporter membrane subunit [Methylomonas sp. MK1]